VELISLTPKQISYLKKYGLTKKFNKQINLLLVNPSHPSLNVEKLEPSNMGLYSFRIDCKYRAIFTTDQKVMKIVLLTNHYK